MAAVPLCFSPSPLVVSSIQPGNAQTRVCGTPPPAANSKPTRRGGATPSSHTADASWFASSAASTATAAQLQAALATGGGYGSSGTAAGTNPWEATLDATPAPRFGGAGGGWGGGAGLALLLPTGASRESLRLFEQRLAAALQPLSGPAGGASGPNRGVMGGGGLGSPVRGAPGSPTRPMTQQGGGAPWFREGPGYGGGAFSPPLPQSPTGGASMAGFYLPTSVVDRPGSPTLIPNGAGAGVAAAANGGGGSSLPPLVPRSAVAAALAVPAGGSEQPWGGAGLPAGMHSAVAEQRGGTIAAVAVSGGGPGMAALTARDLVSPSQQPHAGSAIPIIVTGGGWGGGGAAATGTGTGDDGASWEEVGSPPPTLGRLISARPSNRRQLQLLADWLDNTIGLLWEQHLTQQAQQQQQQTQQGVLSSIGRYTGPGKGGAASRPGTAAPPQASSPLPPPQADATAAAAAAAGPGSRSVGAGNAAVAARFGSVAAGLRELSENLGAVAAAQPGLWAALVEATSAVAGSLVGQLGARCWEEGALLARLWNLHTALLDSGLAAARRAQGGLEAAAADMAAKIRRCGGGVGVGRGGVGGWVGGSVGGST